MPGEDNGGQRRLGIIGIQFERIGSLRSLNHPAAVRGCPKDVCQSCFRLDRLQSFRIEKTLHQLFAESRLNPKREFFRLDPEKVVLAISIGEFKEVTPGIAQVEPEEQEALDKVKARRPRIRLDAIGVKPGAVLHLSRDDTVTAVVTQDGKVEYDGEVLSPSAAALKALHKLGYKSAAASGSEYWMFDGELLDERRRRLEADQFDQPAAGG